MEQENLVAVFLLVVEHVEDLDTVPFKDSSEWLSNTFDAGKKSQNLGLNGITSANLKDLFKYMGHPIY